MRSLLENPVWRKAREDRKCQHLAGAISGVFLAIALVALFDGLLAQMRQGTNELELLPGQAIILSGPVALKNPLASDLIARFSPAEAPLEFELEGYFTGYWFGSGMWRGQIVASQTADPGDYALRIAFRGASSQSAQKYEIKIFANQADMQAASLSFIRRWFDLNPFILAAICGAAGILLGLATYFFGRRFARSLANLGLAEIYSQDPEKCAIWCLAPKSLAPRPGLARMVLDKDGHVFGEARAVTWKKGKLQLVVMDEREIPSGALVCLRHPAGIPD